MKALSLDLHGHSVEQALDALDKFLQKAEAQNAKQVRIVTGKGTGKIQELVTRTLKQGGYPFKFELLSNGKPNEGVLVVFTA